ncbi:hypothetical protein J4456_00380 [Candidatus Pacearchaeota archaeon]|nr:hypothetical protein [Candidatus Pacearchaeota archaeon]
MREKNTRNHASNKQGKKITTVKIYRETKERLDKLKEYKRETYDDVLRKILFILNFLKKDPDKAQKILNKIDSSHKYTQKSNSGNKGIPKDTE